MHLRFVTKTIHAYLDYPVALSLLALPFVIGVGVDNPLARWISPATGVAAFILTILTNHQTGVIRVIPYWMHVAVDRLVGVVFLVVPFVFGFHGLDAWYYWVNAIAVLLVTTVLNAPAAKNDAVGLVRA
jgi:VIT1/CCC1 family predicted Fe2+/Mn2+ transporter